MNTNKVSEIEFHLSSLHELEDFTLRAAELIKEGYTYNEIKRDTYSDSINSYCGKSTYTSEPILHIKMRKKI